MRYLPLTPEDRTEMLAAIGAKTVDDLFIDVPQEVRLDEPLDLPPRRSEWEVEREVAGYAARNLSPADAPCFLGAVRR